MSLRIRFFLLLGLFVLAVLGVATGLSYYTLMISARRADRETASGSIIRAARVLHINAEELSRLARDWAVWDDTYEFMQGKNPEYLERNLIPEKFSTLEVDWLAMFDPQGRSVLERHFHISRGLEEHLPGEVLDLLNETSLAGGACPTSGAAGFATISNTIFILAAVPIMTSKGEGPTQGTFLMGRYLDDRRMRKLRDEVDPSLQIEMAHSKWPLKRLWIQEISWSHLRAEIVIGDITGKKRLVLMLTLPRIAFVQAWKGVSFLIAWMMLAGAVFFGVSAVFLDRWVIRELNTAVDWLQSAERDSWGGQEKEVSALRRLPDEIQALRNAVQRAVKTMRRNMEETARREEEARENRRLVALGTLTAGLAHAINNPNAIMRLNMSVVQKALQRFQGAAVPEEQKFLLEEAEAAVRETLGASERVDRLIRKMRYLSVRTDRKSLNATAAIADVVAGSLQWVQEEMKKKPCVFETHFEGSIPPAKMDPAALTEVLNNLLLNACQAIPERGGRIIVCAWHEPTAGQIVLEVRDNGPGMTPEVLQHAVDPFFTTRRAEGGTGLGLAISLALLQQWGGTLSLRSSPGQGTTARIVLPSASSAEKHSE